MIKTWVIELLIKKIYIYRYFIFFHLFLIFDKEENVISSSVNIVVQIV